MLTASGSILPLLHPDPLWPGHAPFNIQPPQTEQALVSLPLSDTRDSRGQLTRSELENTAPRIKSDFKPKDGDLIEAQRRKRLRKERRIKRIVTVILGYVVMAWMIYLITVTARTTPKVWDPYEILGISTVSTRYHVTGEGAD